MNRHFNRSLAVVLLVTLCCPPKAFAEPAPLTPIPAGEDKIAPVAAGAAAPFSGQLFDASTAIRWANYLQQCRMRLELDVEYQRRLDAADLSLAKTRLELERRQYELVTTDLQKRLDKANEQVANAPFYRSVWFGVVVGVIATSVAVIGGAYAVNAVK